MTCNIDVIIDVEIKDFYVCLKKWLFVWLEAEQYNQSNGEYVVITCKVSYNVFQLRFTKIEGTISFEEIVRRVDDR